MAELTHNQYKHLRDMADGHLTLYASVRRYDETTGRLLNQPELLNIGYDRADILDRDWWKPLLADGLIALPATDGIRCLVTAEGRKAIAEYQGTESTRG